LSENIPKQVGEREEQHSGHERNRADDGKRDGGDLRRAYQIGAQDDTDVGAEDEIVIFVVLHGDRWTPGRAGPHRSRTALPRPAGTRLSVRLPFPSLDNPGRIAHSAAGTFSV